MNPLGYIENFSGAVAQHPLAALGVAAVAGLLTTSVCPCTLPGGMGLAGYSGSQVDSAPEKEQWRRGALIALAFFVGMVTSLTALGIAAANLGHVLTSWEAGFAAAIAIVMLLVGLAAIFSPRCAPAHSGPGDQNPQRDRGRIRIWLAVCRSNDYLVRCAFAFLAHSGRRKRPINVWRLDLTFVRSWSWVTVSANRFVRWKTRGVVCAYAPRAMRH
jgi:cytochrome c biogenesis protein CcdA